MAEYIETELHTKIKYKKGPFVGNLHHLTNHINKIGGKMSDLCDKADHNEAGLQEAAEDFVRKRLPDLVILAQIMADDMNLDLAKLVEARSDELQKK